ncbi:phosphopantetheine-binding protein [Pseudomonas baetica]|uniref:phosphopantetheine-binding protein n=1 Tax=Pseudomonas baetica TaxID=674054 RepID=UPI003EEBFED1
MSNELSAECVVENQVIKVLMDYFPADRRKIEAASRLVEDLYVDSISLVEIVMALNETFGIELPESGVRGWGTVKDICDSVKESL